MTPLEIAIGAATLYVFLVWLIWLFCGMASERACPTESHFELIEVWPGEEIVVLPAWLTESERKVVLFFCERRGDRGGNE